MIIDEVTFDGLPYYCYQTINLFVKTVNDDSSDFVEIRGDTFDEGENDYIRFAIVPNGNNWRGSIEILRKPRGQSLIVLNALDNPLEFEKWWQSIKNELIQAEWIPTQTTIDRTSNGTDFAMPVDGRFGTDRDMSLEDVQAIVKQCLEYRKRGGKVTYFYDRWHFNTGDFALDTLRGWLKNPKFRPEND